MVLDQPALVVFKGVEHVSGKRVGNVVGPRHVNTSSSSHASRSACIA